MTTTLDGSRVFRSIRVALAISGALALLSGIVLLLWPVKAAAVVTGIIAAYLIVVGVVYAGLGIFSATQRGWSRAGHIVLGLLYVVAGVFAFVNLPAAAVTLTLVTVIFIGVSWIVDGVVSLSLLGQDGSRVWTLLYALLGIVAGVIVLLSPAFAAELLWLFLGASLLALGIVQLVRAFTIGKPTRSSAQR